MSGKQPRQEINTIAPQEAVAEPISPTELPTEYVEASRLERLSFPPSIRLPAASGVSFLVGCGLGFTQGGKMAGLRFRAEHAHKVPTNTTGWFLYHKSKNYHTMYGGIREGIKMGARVCLLATAMFNIEYMFDTYRDTKDMFNTIIASVTVAGAFSLYNRYSSPMAYSLPMVARTTKSALIVGLAYGGLQDVVGFARGRQIGYVDFLKQRCSKESALKAVVAAWQDKNIS